MINDNEYYHSGSSSCYWCCCCCILINCFWMNEWLNEWMNEINKCDRFVIVVYCFRVMNNSTIIGLHQSINRSTNRDVIAMNNILAVLLLMLMVAIGNREGIRCELFDIFDSNGVDNSKVRCCCCCWRWHFYRGNDDVCYSLYRWWWCLCDDYTIFLKTHSPARLSKGWR